MDMFGAGMSELADGNWDCIICKFTGGAVGGAAMHIDYRNDQSLEYSQSQHE